MEASDTLRDCVAWEPGRVSSTSSDTAVLGAIALGDRDAFQVFFRRHNVPVYRFALRILDDPAAAEDVVSQVFLAVWRHPRQFEERSKVSTWLLGITRNIALSELRRRPTCELKDDLAENIEDPAERADNLVFESQRSGLIADCLSKLSPKHREVIDLVYYHGKSISEIGEIMGVSVNTVKTRMFYARALLGQAGIDRACV
jgi:RNA polymerase sigma-70 factor (ECF subfamily)